MQEYQRHDENTMHDKKLQLYAETMNQKQNKLSKICFSDNSKYVTTDYQYLNYEKIANILETNGIKIHRADIEIAFDHHNYHKYQLVDDLCDILVNGDSTAILLC
eukprot:396275_1